MLRYWIQQEYYRLHVVEQWPDTPYKHALITAISSKVLSLVRQLPQPVTLELLPELSSGEEPVSQS